MGKFRIEIHNFCQKETETMFEACERFKDFWDSLTPASRRILSNAVGGPLMKRTPEETTLTILDELSEDANQWLFESAERRSPNGVHQVDANTSVQVQLDSMAKEIRNLTLASIQCEPHAACDICGRRHPIHECQASTEEVNVVGNNNFNAMGQRHPDFSWSSSGDAHGAAIKELGAGFRNLERKVGQVATILSERILGTLPADIKRNPKETMNVLKNDDDKKKKGKKGADKKEETSRRKESNEESKHMPALPFPQKLYREKLDKQFEKFLDMLKQVHVNLPFTEVLSQMPAYAKFLKEILTKKRKIEETSVIKLTEHCSAFLRNKLPQKCGYPGSFTITCSLGTINFDKALCDSGASIHLMSLSIYKKLEKEIGEIRSAPISLQLADQMTLIPEGIVEDVLENKEVPLILERPFLSMGRAILDIHDRKPMLRVVEEIVTFEMNVAIGVKKEKPTESVEKVKNSKEKAVVIEKDKCGVYPKKVEKKLSAWMCALVRARGMEPDFDSDPN
ncbi:PREDICTED: uncharacterized protein LOC109210612 [Nicotiana attenuata]|uniref:uncharacterized protein LOC109210612 n=1 Tax=Nicotiana attenuata TaxID=49451 RepID=UPI000905A898|nr:PREDICTED: uncharacterized protein LOC109210612 [Nicotiana attenuata]